MKKIVFLLTVAAFIALPYYLFENKLFIGGDDTRMLYVYPKEFLSAMSLFSWSNVSSLSYYNPSFHFVPFGLAWGAVYSLVNSRIILNYMAFSLPIVLGFIFMKKLLGEIFDGKYYWETYAGSLFYVLSPILIITEFVVFLTPAYLIGVFPLFGFLLLKYIKTGRRKYVLYASTTSIYFSFTFYTFAWIFGLLVPLLFGGLLFCLFLRKMNLRRLILRILFFSFFVITSQLFWIIPFVSSFLFESHIAGGNVFSNAISSTFEPTVLATATGNILYPLLNLFHRQIIIDFEWEYLAQYRNFYDWILILNSIYPIVLFIGVLNGKKIFKPSTYKIYLFLIIAFVFALYFFTINISVLKNIFLLMGRLPGFVMFRNYFDKFSIGYVFIYSLCITGALIVTNLKFKKLRIPLLVFFIALVIVNAIPIKNIVNGPLWKTRDFLKTVHFNNEYLQLTEYIKKSIGKDESILTLPFNAAAYAVIPNDDGKGGYVGTSPMKILTGVNDITGNLSFPSNISGQFLNLLKARDYPGINRFLAAYHINYILRENNLTSELTNGYFFDRDILKLQDENLIKNIGGNKIYQTSKGSYALYHTKKVTPIISGPVKNYQRINDVQYVIQVDLANEKKELIFNDTYHSGWKVFLHDKNSNNGLLNDLLFLVRKPIFENTHRAGENGYVNRWVMSPVGEKNQYNIILYFMPELLFYVGVVCSLFGIALQVILLWKSKLLKNIF